MRNFIIGILAIPLSAFTAAAQAGKTTAVDDDLVISTICTRSAASIPSPAAPGTPHLALDDTSPTQGGVNGVQLRSGWEYASDGTIIAQSDIRVDGVYVADPFLSCWAGGYHPNPDATEEDEEETEDTAQKEIMVVPFGFTVEWGDALRCCCCFGPRSSPTATDSQPPLIIEPAPETGTSVPDIH